jgi:hypothetical protein
VSSQAKAASEIMPGASQIGDLSSRSHAQKLKHPAISANAAWI